MEQQHVMTENEIRDLGYEVNKRDLLDLLKVNNSEISCNLCTCKRLKRVQQLL